MAKRSLPTVSETESGGCCGGAVKALVRDPKSFVRLFKALADETRLEILGMLGSAGRELCVCEFEARFDLSQPTVSHHLKILRDAGLVDAERRGTWVYYALRAEALDGLGEFRALLGK